MSGEIQPSRQTGSSSAPAKKGLYILPSIFTAANIAAGYYAISQAIQGTAGDPWHFDQAAKAIGFAILFDGFDGRIARMTNTTSAFGRELDSLADVIAFGIAPAILAWLWGFRALPGNGRCRTAQQGHTVWRHRDIRFPDGGRCSSGALQHTGQPAAVQSRAVPDESISWACRFRLAQEWLRRWSTSSAEIHCKSGGCRSDGACSSSPSPSSW